MGGMPELYILFYIIAAIGSIATPVAIWWLCAIVKRGFNDHTSTLQLIYEELSKANRTTRA